MLDADASSQNRGKFVYLGIKGTKGAGIILCYR